MSEPGIRPSWWYNEGGGDNVPGNNLAGLEDNSDEDEEGERAIDNIEEAPIDNEVSGDADGPDGSVGNDSRVRGYSYHGHGGNSYGGYSGSYGGGGNTHGGYSTSYGGGGVSSWRA